MKLILITLLCLAASTTATPLLGEKKCTWGPAYWCQHLWSARECGAIEHCAQRVWMLQETPQQEASDADSGCQMCEKMVRGVTVLLDNKSTKGEILKYMERACTGAQTAEGVRACKNAVDAFFPAILDFVAMEMDPMVICTAMKLCPSSNSSSEEVERLENTIEEVLVVKPLLQELAPRVQIVTDVKPMPAVHDEMCDMCTQMVTELQLAAHDNNTKNELIGTLDNVCDMIPTSEVAAMCKGLVNTYLPSLIDAFATMDPKTACADIGMCQATKELKQLAELITNLWELKLNQDGTVCDACKSAVAQLRDGVKRAHGALMNVADKLCDYCPVADKCKVDVQQALDKVFGFIESALAPDMICQMIGVCGAAESNAIPILELTPAEPLPDLTGQAFIQMPLKSMPAKHSKVDASMQCVLCEYVMKELDSVLTENSTEAEIQRALDAVCGYMPATISSECTTFVDAYAQAIISSLAQEMKPALVCTALGLCQARRAPAGAVTIDGAAVPPQQTEVCTLCETVISYVDSLLEDAATEKQITAVVEKICNFIPKNMQQECDTFIEAYGPYVIQLLAQLAKPEEVCSALQVCKVQDQPKHHLLGEKKCTFGPAYWCASEDNAKECNAMEHCKNHAWN